MVSVIAPNEISIAGTIFPTAGPVRVTNISATPNPVVFGDTQRSDQTQSMDQLVQDDWLGGSGIYKGDVRVHTSRSWKTRAETRYRWMLCLPPLAVDMGKPTWVASEDVVASVTYGAVQYFAFGGKVGHWLDTSSSWPGAADHTLAGAATDVIVFNSKMYWATAAGYSSFDGTSWVDSTAINATYFTVWDTKLWAAGRVSGVWTFWSSPDGTTWTQKATFPAEVAVWQLVIYRDATGQSAIYAVTDTGLWIYDATNTRFLQSEVRLPAKLPSGQVSKATNFSDGKLYLSTGGIGALSIQIGNPTVVSPVGLDLDDGLPPEDQGRLIQLVADADFLYAFLDSTTSAVGDDQEMAFPEPFNTEAWSLGQGPSTVRCWHNGWHTLWEASSVATPGTCLVVSGAYDKRRLYFGVNHQIFYINLPSGNYNPRQNASATFATGPVTHITPWWPFESVGKLKLHGHFIVEATRASATETVAVYVTTDLNDSGWTLIGTITAPGRYEYQVGGANGQQFRWVKYRLDLQRGSNSSATPIVEYYVGEAMPLLPPTYGYGVTIDLSHGAVAEHGRGKTAVQLLKALKDLADPTLTPNMVAFSYKDGEDGALVTHYGRISRLNGSEWGGEDRRGEGSYLVSLVAPYRQDSTVA